MAINFNAWSCRLRGHLELLLLVGDGTDDDADHDQRAELQRHDQGTEAQGVRPTSTTVKTITATEKAVSFFQ